jgi:hypothetical protein
MLRSIRLLSVGALVAVPMALGVSAPAGASSRLHFASASARPLAVPNSNVKGKALVFKPSKLTVNYTAPSQVKCTQKNIAFTITNTTKKTIQLNAGGSDVLDPIPGKTIESICLFGQGKQTFVLGIDGASSTLSLKAS